MLVTPLPGTDRRNLRQMMNELHNGAINIRSSKLPGDLAPASAYFRWTDTAVGQLTGQIAECDIERLVLTPRYWALLGSPSVGTPQGLAVIDQEIGQRISDFAAACRELEAQIGRWNDLATYVVPDTSFICNGESLFDQADYHGILEASWLQPIRVLIPIVVVEELDHLKNVSQTVRHRARLSIAILDRVMTTASPQEPSICRLLGEWREPRTSRPGLCRRWFVSTSCFQQLLEPFN
ncbi:MAG: PIN domain-containing protein [Propionibacteriaceae bacterium]